MRICWDNLEGIRLSKTGFLIKNSIALIYKDKCIICGQSYLTEKRRPSKYCSHECVYKSEEFRKKLSIANSGKNNSMYNQTHTRQTREKISKNRKGKLVGKDNPNYGGLTEKHRKNISRSKLGSKLSIETKNKMSKIRKGKQIGQENPMWKGGISSEPYCEIWLDNDYKESIKKRDDYQCLNPECNRTHKKLCIHHIDYIKKNCHPFNLITICTSCNGKANKDRKWHKFWYKAIIYNRYLKK